MTFLFISLTVRQYSLKASVPPSSKANSHTLFVIGTNTPPTIPVAAGHTNVGGHFAAYFKHHVHAKIRLSGLRQIFQSASPP
jgi:hypothetical protein